MELSGVKLGHRWIALYMVDKYVVNSSSPSTVRLLTISCILWGICGSLLSVRKKRDE